VASWLLAYGMKIYFDFSGYSDIAIGSGYLLFALGRIAGVA
jgi:D-alanyl-lipoteichoic acid acyltransferase DltB (MBOAT superfamily)